MLSKALTQSISQYTYSGYVVYLAILWMFVNYGGRGLHPYDGSGARWLLITIPLFLFMGVNLLLVLIHPHLKRNPILLFLTLYLSSLSLIAIINFDIKHLSEIIRWVIPVMLIVHYKVYLRIELLNFIFLMAVVVIVCTFDSIDSDYGFLPGQTTTNLHQGLWWRISIWKYMTPPYSAAFSIIVFFANFFLNKSKSRVAFYILSFYFILLSASRTGYLIFLIVFSVVLLGRFYKFRFNKIYCFLPLASILFVFTLQFFADLIPLLGIQNEFLNSAILRNNNSNGDANNLSSRFLIMQQHIRLVQEAGLSGVFGLGSNIYLSPAWTSNGGAFGGTTDSNVSHLIARDGLSILFLIAAFAYLFIESMKNGNLLAYVVLLSLLLYTVGYGAWLNLTSPVFVIFLGFIYQPQAMKKELLPG
jgi:hypothetical protein